MFSLEKALAESNSIARERMQKRTVKYELHYSNNGVRPEGSIKGFTIKQLINEFRELGQVYKFAFVTDLSGDKILRSFNANNGKKFISHTVKRKTKK